MKELLGLLFGICILAIALYLNATKKLETTPFVGLLAIALIGGLVIASYDRWTEISAPGFSVKTEIEQAGKKEIEAIQKQTHDSLDKLETQLSLATSQIESQKQELEETTTQIHTQKERLRGIIRRAEQVEASIAFQEVIGSARADSREAFDELREIANNANHPRQQRAVQVIHELNITYDYSGIYQVTTLTLEGYGDPLKKIKKLLENPDYTVRCGAINLLGSREDIPLIMETLKTDKSLRVCVAAIHRLNRIVYNGVQTKPLDFQHWFNWWEDNKAAFAGQD